MSNKLPAWCKVGAWITISPMGQILLGPVRRTLYQIARIDEDGLYTVHLDWNGEESFGYKPEDLMPVRFRPCTHEEAKALLGKVIECKMGDGRTNTCLVQCVTFDQHDPDQGVLINHWTQKDLVSYLATIDGVPIGVPELDEEALKDCEAWKKYRAIFNS